MVYTGLQEIPIQECTARSEIEAYISLTRPVRVVNIEIIWTKQAVSTFVYTKTHDAESRHADASHLTRTPLACRRRGSVRLFFFQHKIQPVVVLFLRCKMCLYAGLEIHFFWW